MADADRNGAVDLDSILIQLGGCGLFQVILVGVLFLGETPTAFSSLLMSYGNYNPGWRCLDNTNTSLGNGTALEWKTGACVDYEACENVEFNPESSTVVTEWALACDKAWIPSAIISIQMAGVLLGSWLTGYLGDKIGRRLTLVLDLLLNSVVNIVAYFSTSWEMFAVFRFIIGVTYPCAVYFPFILGSEFSSEKWRSTLASLPTWGIGSIFFALCAMLTKDWRTVQLVSGVLTFVTLLPMLWIPESIRWLTLKKKKRKIIQVADKIAKMNGKYLTKDNIDALDSFCEASCEKSDDSSSRYSWRLLIKGQGLKRTLITTPLWFTMSLTYYVISFGIKSLSGNFYINLMISCAIEMPVFLISSYLPNCMGRKKAVFTQLAISSAGLWVVVALDRLATGSGKGLAIMVVVMVVKTATSSEWYMLQLYVSELYPTVVRTTSLGYASFVARVAGMASPYLIVKDEDTYYVGYTVMAALTLVCSFLLLLLPETKGKQLMETWGDDKTSRGSASDNENESSTLVNLNEDQSQGNETNKVSDESIN